MSEKKGLETQKLPLPDHKEPVTPHPNHQLSAGLNFLVNQKILSFGSEEPVLIVPHCGDDTFFTELDFSAHVHLFDTDPQVADFYQTQNFDNVTFHAVDTNSPTNAEIISGDIYIAMNTYGARPESNFYQLKEGGFALANDHNGDAHFLSQSGLRPIGVIFSSKSGQVEIDITNPAALLKPITTLEEILSIDVVSRITASELIEILRYMLDGQVITAEQVKESHQQQFLSMQERYQTGSYDPIALYSELYQLSQLPVFRLPPRTENTLVKNPETGRLQLASAKNSGAQDQFTKMITFNHPFTGILEIKPLPTQAQSRHKGELIFVFQK
jgi:hypothetical protein